MAAPKYDNVIELDPSDFEEETVYTVKQKQSLMAAIWFRLTRFVRRALAGSKRALAKMWMKIPRRFQFILRFTATVVGWFMAYMLFYISVIIAFYYSLALGIGVLAIWAAMLAWYVYDDDVSGRYFA